MHLSWLKWVRRAVAIIVLAGLTLAFVDFRDMLPDRVAHVLASVQLVPSAARAALLAGIPLVLIGLLLLTVAAGRVYCSAICPLGILQDVLLRVERWFRRKPRLLRYAPPATLMRHLVFWPVVASVFLGGAGLAVAWFDPYSNFGRIASMLLKPLLLEINNLLVPLASKAGWNGLYHVDILWPPLVALAAVSAFALLLVILTVWRGRIYCNTLCPVGTLLGWISSRSALRLQINPAACGKCAECLKECKVQCIDLKHNSVDASRCVSCFNCLAACDRGAMELKWSWNVSAPQPAAPDTFDGGRRQFLLTATGGVLVAGAVLLPSPVLADEKKRGKDHGKDRNRHGHRHVITPPLAGTIHHFLEQCTACQLCVSACPTGVLQPALFQYGAFDLLKPHMDYNRAFCNYTCTRCTEVCPSGALLPLSVEQKQITRIGMAHFTQSNCIVEKDSTDCAACSEHCPTKAVHTIPYRDGLFLPEVTDELCIGCGACEYACPAKPKAIIVHGAPKTKIAQRNIEKKADSPVPGKDFPF